MKLKHWSRSLLAATAVLASGLGLISCGTSNTVDYLYATSARNNPGQINVYRVDSQSGALTQIPDSPFNAGRNPVALVIDGAGDSLYVANRIDNSIIQYGIGTDAKLYGATTVNPSGSEPVWLAIHSYFDTSNKYLGSLLFVVENLQPNFTDLNPGPGALYVYRIPAGQTLSTPVTQTVNGVSQDFYPIGNAPTGAAATPDGEQVYVTDILSANETGTGASTTCGPGQGGIEGFNIDGGTDGSGNPATALPAGTITAAVGSPFCAGAAPSAVAVHPYSTFLYVTDSALNQVTAYSVQKQTGTGSNQGALRALSNGPVTTGTTPDGVTVDPRGKYVYVANRIGSLSGYAVNLGTGALSALAAGGSGSTGAGASCVIVEPALGRFVYTANLIDGSVSGFTLNPNDGSLAGTQNSPYQTTGLTSCVAATVHGNHPTIHVQNSAGN